MRWCAARRSISAAPSGSEPPAAPPNCPLVLAA
jgi:hypothetical protein